MATRSVLNWGGQLWKGTAAAQWSILRSEKKDISFNYQYAPTRPFWGLKLRFLCIFRISGRYEVETVFKQPGQGSGHPNSFTRLHMAVMRRVYLKWGFRVLLPGIRARRYWTKRGFLSASINLMSFNLNAFFWCAKKKVHQSDFLVTSQRNAAQTIVSQCEVCCCGPPLRRNFTWRPTLWNILWNLRCHP